jgi:hypothetical protein
LLSERPNALGLLPFRLFELTRHISEPAEDLRLVEIADVVAAGAAEGDKASPRSRIRIEWMPTAAEFESEIRAMISRAIQQKRPHLEINAGELRRPLGGYPGHNHSMPSCCAAMRAKLEEFGGEGVNHVTCYKSELD